MQTTINTQESPSAVAPCCSDTAERLAAGEPCCTPQQRQDAEATAANAASGGVGAGIGADEREIKEVVQAYYAERAVTRTSCCDGTCGCGSEADFDRIGAAVGYSQEELEAAPEGANLGLGCGNPTALGRIREGETVLDLGSGAGMDAFLAARQVGTTGRVIGVDMTPEMVELARENAARVGTDNVEFRLGEIEDLPLADESVDVVISNCVINLSTDKSRVFREAFRVLRPGGRLMVSDLVLTRELPDYIRDSASAYAGCVAGAELMYHYLAQIESAGFTGIQASGEDDYLKILGDDAATWIPEDRREEARAFLDGTPPVVSLKVVATKA